MSDRRYGCSRREFLGDLTLAGTGGILGVLPPHAAAEQPPETTRLRVSDSTVLCFAPQYVAEDLLRAEGFSQVEFTQRTPQVNTAALFGTAEADIGLALTPSALLEIDAGKPLVLLAGGHVGCYELYAPHRIRAVSELKGKAISIPRRDGGAHVMAQLILANIGIDPRRDVEWRVDPWTEVPRLLAEEKIDAYLVFPPEPQELRTRNIGHVILSTRDDRPWSQYFCCMVAANREFVRKYPIATKRALRAILKGMEICATDPERAARAAVVHNPQAKLGDVLQMVKDLRYGTWREFSAEDTARFFALRMRDIGMLKANPQKLLAQGTDWRFINELKRELKA